MVCWLVGWLRLANGWLMVGRLAKVCLVGHRGEAIRNFETITVFWRLANLEIETQPCSMKVSCC